LKEKLMSDCDEIRPMLTALLDSELPPEDAARVEVHMTLCAGCAAVLAEYRALRKAVETAPIPEAVDIWARVSAELSQDSLVDVVHELRVMREEMQGLREEVAALRQELSNRQPPAITPTPAPLLKGRESSIRSTALSLPYMADRLPKPYQLV
jgi:anti-sigma factor RsiW